MQLIRHCLDFYLGETAMLCLNMIISTTRLLLHFNINNITFTIRIQAKTRELRERQARERDYAEILDISRSPERSSEEDHQYAGINQLNSSMDSGHSRPHSPRDEHPHIHPQHQHSDTLYTQVSKARNERPPSADR